MLLPKALLLAAAVAAAPAAPPPELATARQAIADAAVKKDRTKLATLIAFPLALDNYGSPPTVSRAAFLSGRRWFETIFGDGDADLAHCISSSSATLQTKAKAFGGHAWLADCNGNEYFFALRGGAWRLVAYQNINE